MRKLPPLNAVRAFEAAARHVSFTRAGEELHVTHGAVSRQVALLENWLGTQLFRRAQSQLTLTEAGRRYLAEVTPALDRLAVASAHLVQQVSPTSLAINAPPTFTMRWLIPRISAFQRKQPDIEVRLTTSLAPVNFQEHGYDIAVRGAHAQLAGCRSRPFMTEQIVPICRADLLASGALSEPGALAKQTLISYATEPYSWPQWLVAAGCPALKPAATLQFEQMYFALHAAAEGLGLVLVPLFLVIDEVIAGQLCAPFGSLARLERRYYANSASTSDANVAVTSFCDWLVNEGRDTERSIAAWAKATGWRL
jgi:LysR family glycine cleavage system transcriptional activator